MKNQPDFVPAFMPEIGSYLVELLLSFQLESKQLLDNLIART